MATLTFLTLACVVTSLMRSTQASAITHQDVGVMIDNELDEIRGKISILESNDAQKTKTIENLSETLKLLDNQVQAVINDGFNQTSQFEGQITRLAEAAHIETGVTSSYNTIGWTGKPLSDVMHVTFKRPYNKAPRVALALKEFGGLSLLEDGVSKIIWHLNAKNITKTGFDIEFKTEDSKQKKERSLKVYFVDISWISIPNIELDQE